MESKSPSSAKVLIVDDSDTMRGILNAILATANIKVVGQLSSGLKLLHTISLSPPDIVCLDYNLPDINGLELLKSIVVEYPNIAVVMITGEQDPNFRSIAAAAGAAGFIQKPFSEDQVIKEFKSVIQTRQLLAQQLINSDPAEVVAQSDDKKTAIIADDSKTMRVLLMAILAKQHIAVLAEATNGIQAVELAVQHQPDIVCLDIDMPGMTGLVALKEIRQKVPSSKVLMITGNAQRETVMEAAKLGVVGYISKPFSPEKVADAIKKAMSVQA